MTKNVVVAIPARDEADRIGSCLNALNAQTRMPDRVVLIVNNSTDDTETIARAMASGMRYRLDVIKRELPPAEANAGHARRLAMEAAAARAGPDGILLTTDADSLVPPDWVFLNIRALRQGADVVCGRAVIDTVEAAVIPEHLHVADAREGRLIAFLDDLAWMLDPEPRDPPPRHTEASGASLAVSVEAFQRIGGLPPIAFCEDRAFVRALWMVDACIRHDPAIVVNVSGRIVGRAPGGMADTIRRRMVRQDEFSDDKAEPALDAFWRYSLRYRARVAWGGRADPALAAALAMPGEQVFDILSQRFFGTAWSMLEITSPVLKRRRVRFVDIPTQIASARVLLERLAMTDVLAAD